MTRGQLILALLAAIAVGAVAWAAGGSGGGDKNSGGSSGEPDAKTPANAIVVSFAYSPEKEKLLAPLIKEFNAKGETVSGRPVVIKGSNVASGEAESRIASGSLKPVAWSPASSLWGRLVNFEADRALAPEESPSLVRTPLVIAMWEPMARALGWPRKPLGFKDILALADDPQGWAGKGHPEFGAFRLVHTNPDFSTAGLSAVVAEYYAATGKKEGLRENEVTSSKARKTVKGIERSIVHYGDTTLFIAEQMRKEGPGYASAAAMEEVTLLDFNRTRGSADRLVAIYPSEGTFYSDNPFIVLDAPWVRPEQAEGAKAFQRFLAEKLTTELAARSGFRPADLDAKPVAPITAANGVDPAQPKRVLGLPEPRVLAAIKQSWREDRKPANILLVLDTSGSMFEENRLDRAKAGLGAFFAGVGKQDSLGLTTFSDEIREVTPVGPFDAQGKAQLEGLVKNLVAEGGTAFYDATLRAFDTVRPLADRDHITAVVLLTDGEDTDSASTVDDVVGRLRSQGDTENKVRVFTIAYSAGATGAKEQLAKIAEASGGQSYEGRTSDIESVYRSISSFF
jgi:Ca-activated chloride channel family protein